MTVSQSTPDMSSTEYERLTRDVYAALLRSEGVDTVDVRHNTDILGRSGCAHQIDVYWEFRLGGVLFRTAIECKRYASTLEIGRVRDFYAALADVGNIQGIVITTVGYQSGAKKFADYYGINLLELRAPTGTDWEGTFRDIGITINACAPILVGVGMTIDRAWHAANLSRLPPEFRVVFAGMDNEVGVLDAQGNLVRSIHDIVQGLPPFIYDPTTDDPSAECRTHKINDQGMFVKDPVFGLIPIQELALTYKVHVDTMQISILGAEIVKYILRDLKTGQIHRFKAEGGVIDVIAPPAA